VNNCAAFTIDIHYTNAYVPVSEMKARGTGARSRTRKVID